MARFQVVAPNKEHLQTVVLDLDKEDLGLSSDEGWKSLGVEFEKAGWERALGRILRNPSTSVLCADGSPVLKFNESSVMGKLTDPAAAQSSGDWEYEYDKRVKLHWVVLTALEQYALGRGSVWPGDRQDLLDLIDLFQKFSPGRKLPDSYGRAEIVNVYRKLANREYRPPEVPSRDPEVDLIDRLLYGMAPLEWEGNDSQVVVMEWPANIHRGSPDVFLPSVEVQVDGLRSSPRVVAISVELHAGEPDGGAVPVHKAKYTPRDGTAWNYAMHCARVANLLHGQIAGHLGRSHLGLEQYRLAFDNSFEPSRTSPFWKLVRPFLYMVSEINELGGPLIYGDGGILSTTSALGADGLDAALETVLDSETWDSWRGRANYHGALGEFFGAFQQGVDAWLAGWAAKHQVQLKASWSEIEEFVEAVSAQREIQNLSPCPNVLDLQGLQELLAHVIFLGCFLHSWANDRQWELGGDGWIASFALREAMPPQDGQSYEHWLERAAPTSGDLWFQTMIADVLTHTEYGRVRNFEHNEIEPLDSEDLQTFQGFLASVRSTWRKDVADRLGRSLGSLRPFIAI